MMTKVMDSDCPFEQGTPMRLLWEQQKAATKVKRLNSIRWHPVMIRWCLSIYLRSPGIYKLLKLDQLKSHPNR